MAYMTAVAPVTALTSPAQLLNGPNPIRPTTSATMIEMTGTPRESVRARAPGISRSSPSA